MMLHGLQVANTSPTGGDALSHNNTDAMILIIILGGRIQKGRPLRMAQTLSLTVQTTLSILVRTLAQYEHYPVVIGNTPIL